MAEPSSPSPQTPRLRPVQRLDAGRGFALFGFLLALAAGWTGALFNPALLRSPPARLDDGSWATAYQADFDRELVWSAPARQLWSAIDLAGFRQPPAGVLLGRDGWLFTTEEYAMDGDPEGVRRSWTELIANAHEQLAAAGIDLLVALVPAKASSLPSAPSPLPVAAAERYERSLADLADLGVATVDLRPALASEDAWLRTDSHWTPLGAMRAAEAIAAAASQLTPTMVADHRYVMETNETTAFRGDLDRLLALGSLADTLGPPPDALQQYTFSTEGELGTDLFNEVSVEVTLVGTSYSAGAAWSLADRLRLALSVDVLDVSESGRGPLRPMQDYLASEALLNAPPQLVVWELPERYLTDARFLPGGSSDGSMALALPW